MLEFIAHSTGGLYFDRDTLNKACFEQNASFSILDDKNYCGAFLNHPIDSFLPISKIYEISQIDVF